MIPLLYGLVVWVISKNLNGSKHKAPNRTTSWCWMMLVRLSSESSCFWVQAPRQVDWWGIYNAVVNLLIKPWCTTVWSNMQISSDSLIIRQHSKLLGRIPWISPLKHRFMAWSPMFPTKRIDQFQWFSTLWLLMCQVVSIGISEFEGSYTHLIVCTYMHIYTA